MAKYVFRTEREKVHAQFLLKELCEFVDTIFLEWLRKQRLAKSSVLALEQAQSTEDFKNLGVRHIDMLRDTALLSLPQDIQNTMLFLKEYVALSEEAETCANTIFHIIEQSTNGLLPKEEAERMIRAHVQSFIAKIQTLQKELDVHKE